jgi:hypothetical protein
MKKIAFIMFVAGAMILLFGCASASSESEVMVDTSAKTRQHVPNGASEPGDASRMADPFLSN